MLLRRTFTELQQRSQHLPKHLRLRQDEFVMDPSISEQLQQQLSDKVGERREGGREREREGERGRERGSGGRKGERGELTKVNQKKITLLFFIIFPLPVGAGKEGDGLGV